MAERKQFEHLPVANPKLLELLDTSKSRPVTEAVLREQRISFAFGNAPFNEQNITKDSVRLASQRISLMVSGV
jgi:hypothetical protein